MNDGIILTVNAELNPTCHLLALLGTRHILHVGRIRVNVEAQHLQIYLGYMNWSEVFTKAKIRTITSRWSPAATTPY